MEQLLELINRCKCSVTLQVNNHKDYYETTTEYIEEWHRSGELSDTPDTVIAEMIRLDRIVELQFYPDTPGGFYKIYHHDVSEAIRIALETLNETKEGL